MRKIKHKGIEISLSFLRENKRTALTLLSALILTDIFFIKMSSDLIIFSVLLFYAFFAKIFKIKSKLTISLCLGLLIVTSIDYLITEAFETRCPESHGLHVFETVTERIRDEHDRFVFILKGVREIT